jgi:hypothetical protein
MSIKLEHTYAFIGGVIVGKYTSIVPTVIITGVLLYVADPTIFTASSLVTGKTMVIELFKNITKPI